MSEPPVRAIRCPACGRRNVIRVKEPRTGRRCRACRHLLKERYHG